ncbi:uncharacterized protein LOC122264970 [Penaeus japonicus]|uniref:uncharacterized protein LOC122264970 n=1 Tax=Penaeus japonicus TaxID=27405 RepID=UPI001C715595|nr:uncharacterized protein LOC122264970 [Penaeus japonicus]
MLAFYTFFSILNLRSQISNRPFMSTINVFLCVLGVTRAACFLIDPYTSGQVMPGFLGSVMWDVGYPCILSAFSLIQLAFSQLTQVKFRPETLRRKSALSLMITTHFALVLGADIVTAFENHLQVVRWVVQTVFLSWGLVLCVTFLYGGGRIIRLLRTIPHTAFQGGDSCTPNNKGILQLALLAQCNNIASTVLTAATPSVLTPKIKITDEYDHTYSYVSEGSRMSSLQTSDPETALSSRRPSARSAQHENVTASTSGVRAHDCGSRIGEEDEEVPGSPASGRRTSDVSPREEGELEEATQSTDSLLGKTKVRDSDNALGIVIKVEDFGGGDVTETDKDFTDKRVENKEEGSDKSGVKSEKGNSKECKGDDDEAKMANIEAVMKAISDSIPVVKSSDGNPTLDSASDSVAKLGSTEEANTGCKVVSEVTKAKENAEKCLKTSSGEELVPKRKKSLTWSENTQTIESNGAERDHSRRSSEVDDPDKCLRDMGRRHSASSRPSSRNSERSRGRNNRSCELGDISGRRRSSTVSTYSSRKGSESFHNLPGPRREHRSLSTSSASSSRRNSRRSIKDEAEVETLLARSPDGRSDVTLASILNHIAYVNQAASSAKLPSSLKDSRKAQVQQVLLVTYVTAALGTLLSLALVYGVYGHFSSVNVFARPPWLWFTYESSCRFLEFLMGCAMANITRQPVNRHPQYPYSLRLKQRNSLYM